MEKRPDAESILSTFFKIVLICGVGVFFIGFPVLESDDAIGGTMIASGIALMISSVSIAVVIRIHNVLLDIRDAEFAQERHLKKILEQMNSSQNSNIAPVTIPVAEEVIAESEAENPDKLQEWKDAQILKAKAALEAGKISEEKYTSYVNKVIACQKIPEKK